jgi:hypothetical protein
MTMVKFRGRMVHEAYPARHAEAQAWLTYDDLDDAGTAYARIPYVADGSVTGRCHDCAVEPGELHLPGCDDEECPACGGQVISCGCGGDEDDE